jgi:hypothetical protein
MDNQSNLLMKPRHIDMPDRTQWQLAYHQLKIDFTEYSLATLGATPDVASAGYIQRNAAVCLFLFSRCQKAHSAGDPTLLAKDYKADWDRQVRTLATAVLGRDLRLTAWQAIMIMGGRVCGNPVCAALGMSQEICGVCLKGAKAPEPPAKFHTAKAAARAAFKASHPNFPNDNAELTAFNKFNNNEFVWKSQDQKMPTSRIEALQYIFTHQQRIGMPFCLA